MSKSSVEEQVEFICSLTGYGGQLHPNDITHCFEKVITHTHQEVIKMLQTLPKGTNGNGQKWVMEKDIDNIITKLQYVDNPTPPTNTKVE